MPSLHASAFRWYDPLLWRLQQLLTNPIIGRMVSYVIGDVIRSRTGVIDVRRGDLAPSTKARIFWGYYEDHELRFIRRYLRCDLDVIELGSGLGITTATIAQLVSRTCSILSVEANPHLLDVIALNVSNNAPQARVHIVNAAVDYSGTPNVEFGLHSNIAWSKVGQHPGVTSMCVVTATTLAQLLSAYSIGDYVLVCDIEGAEAGIVLLDDAALGQCRQLIIELHDSVLGNQAYSVTELCERLESVHDFVLRDRRCNVFCFERCTVRNRR